MCRRSCFYPVIQRIYVKFWKVAVLHVPHIKHLHEDKVKHNVALMLLKCMCEEVSKLNSYNEAFGHYGMAFKLAVENDTHEAVEAIIECIPQATLTKFDDYYLSQHAIKSRCEKVYNFLVQHVEENHFLRLYIDRNSNNLLHLAGELAPKHKLDLVSGAALQMQRELQWFQEVEKIVLPSDKQQKNNQEETPMMVFIRAHKELRRAGEEWIKKTADSCTITTALIITIAFAAAITVPGGNNGDTGKAIYATKVSFIIFAVSDAISLFTSTTSLLLFQSILTARYIDEDFLYRLPKRLILGLATLFLSMTSMMVAFSATLYLLFGQENSWILIPIATLTCLPIASFVMFQFPLLFELINSTYFPRIFSKRSRRMIK
ncbi:hypothetical protein L6452_30658 [Arctium lappa]|uniref:Uncharacterized protein n=1 Tax=Arctium lappa TaxID=4217 RepID=A0ACB8ZIT0_ARCLA|nr:hypothetical protein L6452_30658 [Arctium lappa]